MTSQTIYSRAGLIPSARYAPARGQALGRFKLLNALYVLVLNPRTIHIYQNQHTSVPLGRGC